MLIVAAVLSLLCWGAFNVWAGGNSPIVTIDGAAVSMTGNQGEIYIDGEGRLMVPVRFISEKLGATVIWDQKNQTATINDGIRIKVGDVMLITPLGSVKMDTRAVVKDFRLYVPARYIVNALGHTVNATEKNSRIKAEIVTKSEVTVSAAASLKDAVTELKALYLQENPNVKLVLNFGSSGALAQQIEQGAEVDVFFSAAVDKMDSLKSKGLIDSSTRVNLVGNRMVLVVPKDSQLGITSIQDLADTSVKSVALGEPGSVPAGQYAEQVLTQLGILKAVQGKAVYGKDVREVLTWVETANVEAGIVYSTDAKISPKVRIAAVAPADSHNPIVYPAAVIKDSKHPEAAKAFVIFLKGSNAKRVFEKYGFDSL